MPQPIQGVTVTLGSAFTLTDAGGNFVWARSFGDTGSSVLWAPQDAAPSARSPQANADSDRVVIRMGALRFGPTTTPRNV